MKHNTKRAVASILTAMMALGAFGIAGCKNDEQGAVIPAPETQESTTQSGGTSASRPMVNKEVYGEPYKGTIVRCGQSYDFTGGSIGFLAEELTGLSEGENYTVELVATVEPADAKQDVSWAVAFVNPASEWATGKNVSDYVSIEYSEEESTKLSVTCKKAFSEQVKITCTYVHNTAISVDCVVDFVSAWENVTLKMGDDVVNLGGVTDVWWETNASADAGIAWGGDISLDIQTAEAGTVTGYTYRVDLLPPTYWYNQDKLEIGYNEYMWAGNIALDGYFEFNEYAYKYNVPAMSMTGTLTDEDPSIKKIDCSLFNSQGAGANLNTFNLWTKEVTWNNPTYDFFGTTDYGYSTNKYKVGKHLLETEPPETITISGMASTFSKTEYHSIYQLTEGSLCTVLLTVTSASGTQMQYMSLLNLTEFRYTPAATAVSLSSSKIKVSYEP